MKNSPFRSKRIAENDRMRKEEFDAAVSGLENRIGNPPYPAVRVCQEIGISPPSAYDRQWKPLFDAARKRGIIQTVNRNHRKPRR